MSENVSFLQKHDFLLRRLHSLAGLVPVGLYMCVHLATNASILNGVEAFQNAVYQIHSLGNALVVVEWTFIFLPLLFHALFGVVLAFGSQVNVSRYNYGSNWRYVLQRVTGLIAFVYIFGHVAHYHGWFHIGPWLEIMHSLGLAQFHPYNAASTAAMALQDSILWQGFYLVGISACVFHFANGLWTMGITWGLWTTQSAQTRANYVVTAIGLLVWFVGMSAFAGFVSLDANEAATIENQMYIESVKSGRIVANEEKLADPKVVEQLEKLDD